MTANFIYYMFKYLFACLFIDIDTHFLQRLPTFKLHFVRINPLSVSIFVTYKIKLAKVVQ